MKDNPNEGLAKVYWVIGIIVIGLLVLAGILWWYDAYLLHEVAEHGGH
ncbi:MAG: hypothetical protein IRZ10_08590 [Thermoflavifilum sp.]|nr:hypothetical protein [Thermoflavifilum sp.]MCL6514469.1 hypothetical protein [Alicyclobacillus sp.]